MPYEKPLLRHASLGDKALVPTERRRLFASEFIIDFSVSRAAARAGLTPTAGYEAIKDPRVRQLIDQYLVVREKRNEIKIEEVIQ